MHNILSKAFLYLKRFDGAWMFANWESETPLTEAVIQDDQKAVAVLAKNAAQRQAQNFMGFNGIEIARFLGREKCVQILKKEKPRTFSVRFKGEKTFVCLNEEELEKQFGFHYLHNNRFSSYLLFKRVVHECPLQYREGPDADTARYAARILKNEMPKFRIDWIDETLGYGLFADEPIPQNAFVGSYLGEVRRVALWLTQNSYSIFYPSFGIVRYAIDAEAQGNETRFMNHSTQGNLVPRIFPDRGLLNFFFVANRDIVKGEQLLWDYGVDFWASKNPPVEICSSREKNSPKH